MNDMPDRPLDPPDTGFINECARCGKEFHAYDLCVPWCEDCTPRSITDGILKTVVDITATQKRPTMECPECQEISYKWVATTYSVEGAVTLEYHCDECNTFGFFNEHPKRDSGGVGVEKEATSVQTLSSSRKLEL